MNKTPHFQVLAKPIGPLCNMDCTYCFYLEKELLFLKDSAARKLNWVMPDEILENYIQQKLQSNALTEETFVWQGGEPTLLGLDYFHKIVQIQQKYRNGKTIQNSLQTNGILIDEDWCQFFAEFNFLIGISIDGPRELHNRLRIDKGGKPTFDKVMQALNLLVKHRVEFNTLTTVHSFNASYPLEIYHFLKDIGSQYMQFIPIVERIAESEAADELAANMPDNNNATVTEWSVKPEQYGKFLISIFDEWVRTDVGKIFVQTFDVSLEAWYGRPTSLCIFNETCGQAPVIEHNGDIYSCDHFVYPENKIGNIQNDSLLKILQSPRQLKFGNEKRDSLPHFCRQCEFRFACHGECPKNRFLLTEDGEFGLNYLCAGYKMYFEHIDPHMKYMVNELKSRHSPANIMNWIAEMELIEI